MSALYKIVAGSLAVAGWTGLGCLLWSFMAPKQDQLIEMRMKETRENPARMAELRSQNEMVLKVLKESAETKVNIASKPKWNAR
ncbi:ubiquinol-cytochrome-c reductase complex assembly factor 3-like [Hyla sarda]|uniref:ubiquinol-cytochrome-c reductase complex assembly factor 3-like n=1 Tax=Hyla sarda TaxID=327740 RepID=UPI0024C399E9|nr:ubiquinol-cytochrome-c reductase complex assembly factor 3-like [Hyla sarda]